MIKIQCAWCGKEIAVYPCKLKPRNFCSRKCLAAVSSKSKNPEKYRELKDYTNMSVHMRRLNAELNPTRMDFSTRSKLSVLKRGTGSGKSYAKSLGIHIHRTVAARLLGRELQPGEVVHHKDGNKQNNNPKNLMVFQSQAEHARWHREHRGGDAE